MLPEFMYKLRKLVFDTRKNRPATNTLLPGAELSSYSNKNTDIRIHQYSKSFFSIRLVMTRMLRTIRYSVKEKRAGIRLEVVLTGELNQRTTSGDTVTIRSGEYRLSDNPEFVLLFQRKSACSYFITRYSDEMLEQIGIKDLVKPCTPRFLSPRMQELIQKLLHPSFEGPLRDFYYDNCIRELLFLHFTDTKTNLPGFLTNEDISRLYHADGLLRLNLKLHDPIPELADKLGINEVKLKKGFQVLFGMGVFERLTFHRMQLAESLLKDTRRTIEDIAEETGYSSHTSFITAFKRLHNTTPKQWRLAH